MSNVKQLQVNDFKALYDSQPEGHVFIDLREPVEWEEGVIEGVDKLSMGDFPQHWDDWDKSKTYVLICRSGNRSNQVAHAMLDRGFEKTINFNGGMLDWYAEGFPTV